MAVLGTPVTMQSFVELARKITKHREAIDHALDSGLSNGLIESTNTKIRLLTRIAFGFHDPNPSSPSPCSPSAATRRASQAEHDPQIEQKGPIWSLADDGSTEVGDRVADPGEDRVVVRQLLAAEVQVGFVTREVDREAQRVEYLHVVAAFDGG